MSLLKLDPKLDRSEEFVSRLEKLFECDWLTALHQPTYALAEIAEKVPESRRGPMTDADRDLVVAFIRVLASKAGGDARLHAWLLSEEAAAAEWLLDLEDEQQPLEGAA